MYNVGTGDAYSFNRMIELINDELGTDVEPEYIDCPFDDYVEHTCADPSKFSRATGWSPSINFEDGVKMVCQSYLD